MTIAETGTRLLLAKVISTVVLFLGLVYFAREFSPALMGSFFLFRVLVDGSGLVSDFGIKRAVEKRISEEDHPSGILTTGFLMKTASTLTVAAIILALQQPLNGYLGAPLAHLLAISLVVGELGWFFVHVLRGEFRVGESAVIEASRLIVWVGVSVVLIELGYGFEAIIYGFISGVAVLGTWAFTRIDTPFGRPSVELANSIVSFSKYDFISESGGYVYNWVDVGLIGLFLTQSAVGIYEFAWQITIPVALVYETTTTTLFPEISRWHSSKSTEEITRVMSQAMTVGLFISVPALFGALVLSEQILELVYGPAYVAGASVLVILLGEKVIGSFQSVMNITLRGIDQPREAALVTTFTIVTNLGLNVFMIPRYGIIGAAVATLFSNLINFALTYYHLRKHIEVNLPLGAAVRIVGTASGMLVVVYVFESLIPVDSILLLAVSVLCGVVVYVLLCSLVSSLRQTVMLPGLRSFASIFGYRWQE